MTDLLAIICVALSGAVLAAAIVFDARRRKERRIQASLAMPAASGPAQ